MVPPPTPPGPFPPSPLMYVAKSSSANHHGGTTRGACKISDKKILVKGSCMDIEQPGNFVAKACENKPTGADLSNMVCMGLREGDVCERAPTADWSARMATTRRSRATPVALGTCPPTWSARRPRDSTKRKSAHRRHWAYEGSSPRRS